MGGRRLLVFRQRERSYMPVWHLLFVGCLTRVRTDTSTCNSSTCSPVETRHPQVKDATQVQYFLALPHIHDTIFLNKYQGKSKRETQGIRNSNECHHYWICHLQPIQSIVGATLAVALFLSSTQSFIA